MAKVANPFMHYVADYEKEAEAFLTKYECADAIDNHRACNGEHFHSHTSHQSLRP